MKVTLTKRNGAVSMEKSFGFICSQLRDGVYELSIKRKTKARTLSQNGLLWLWYTCLANSFEGTCKDDWHEYYKHKFNAKVLIVDGKDVRVAQSTATLSTLQMSRYMDMIQADAATEFGVTLPLPGDRYYEEFIDYYKDR